MEEFTSIVHCGKGRAFGSERMFFTARFARDAKFAKEDIFFIAADPREIGFAFHGARRAAMKNHSATEAAAAKARAKQL